MLTINVSYILIFIYSFSKKVDLDITFDKGLKKCLFLSCQLWWVHIRIYTLKSLLCCTASRNTRVTLYTRVNREKQNSQIPLLKLEYLENCLREICGDISNFFWMMLFLRLCEGHINKMFNLCKVVSILCSIYCCGKKQANYVR